MYLYWGSKNRPALNRMMWNAPEADRFFDAARTATTDADRV